MPRGVRFSRWVIRRLGSKTLYLLILATIIGVIGGLGAVLFRFMIAVVNKAAYPHGVSVAELAALPWYALMLPPILGGAVVGPLVYMFAREAKGHGVPEVIDAVQNRGGRIRSRVAIVKIIASAVSIGVGGSVGREGPIVQIGASIGSTLGQLLQLDARSVRLLLACGAASGVAATFNAPIAGALFSLEIIIGTGTVRQFAPLVVATVAGTAVSRGILGDLPAFQVPSYALESPWQLVSYTVLGVVAGAVGVGFSRGLYLVEDVWDRIRLHDAAKPLLGGLLIGLVGLAFPQVMGSSYEPIDHVLAGDGHLGLMLVVLLLLAKIVATHISLASGFSGGVFAPSLFVGAMLGAAFGMASAHVLPPAFVAPSGAYAVVGMGAVVAATTHAPLTVILITFEMTGDYRMILPLMFTTLIASTLSLRLSAASIYTLKLLRRGSKVGGRSDIMLSSTVGMLMRSAHWTVARDASWGAMVDTVLAASGAPAYVVDETGRLWGAILLEDVAALIRDEGVLKDLLIAADVMREAPEPAKVDDSLTACLKSLGQEGIEERPVVDAQGKLLGVVARSDLLALYDREVLRQGAGEFTFTEQGTEGEAIYTTVNVPKDTRLETVVVTGELIGRSLRSLDLRARWQVNVHGIRDAEGSAQPPDPTEPLEEGQALLVSGPPNGIRELRKLASEHA